MHIKMKSGPFPGVVVVLIIISVLILVFVNPWGSTQKKDRQIILRDPAKVDQILISGPMGSVELIRTGEDWFLPGGERASQVSVENLLFAAGRLQVDAVRTDLSDWDDEAAKQVSYLSSEKLVLQYVAMSRDGGFLLQPTGSERAYAVSFPAYPELNLDQVFSDSAYHYMDHLLIDLLPKEIRLIEVEKKGSPPFRFTRSDADSLRCELPRSDSLVPMEVLDEESVRMLFTYFTSIRFEAKARDMDYRLSEEEMDERWLASLYVESVEGKKHRMEVYSLPGEEGELAHMFRALVIHNMSPEPLLINYIYLDVLMRGLPAYFGDNSLRH